MAAKYNDDVYVNDLYRCQEVKGTEGEEFIGHLSYGLYKLTSDIIGDEEIIRIRRQTTDLHNEYDYTVARITDAPFYVILSGSLGEGFRFSSSDLDLMSIYRHIKVIHSLTNNHHYDENTTLLLMEDDKTRPGFVLLRLIGNAYDPDIQRSCVSYLSSTYISSQKWRDENPYRLKSDTIHGPCYSGMAGTTEYDQAFCLHSYKWPDYAYGFIRRLLSRRWPPAEVVKDIITGGVDFVPICSKESNHELLEWRISFSMAEKKLIHAMNHTQFMCYGLLKIFLKEAISSVESIKSILCSYFLKTSVFWEILNPSMSWVPNTLLSCFWQCFRKLISWIEKEYLPNFFIPENNMLIGKFQPGQKKVLLGHLYLLHSEGYSCLLRCPSLCSVFIGVIHRPLTAYSLFEIDEEYRKCSYDISSIMEICNVGPTAATDLSIQLNRLQTMVCMCSSYSRCRLIHVLSIWLCNVMQYLAVLLHCNLSVKSLQSNKGFHQQTRSLINTLIRSRTDCVSHYIHAAICLYRCQIYETVIDIIRKAESKLQNRHLMYMDTQDIDKYRAAGGAHTPYHIMMRKYMVRDIVLVTMTCIPELELEHQVAREHSTDHIFFPPLVITKFLHCLSCFHLGYHALVQQAVSDLHALVHYDDGYHIEDSNKAISWQILGICQEMIRDYQGAMQSYCNAFDDEISRIKPASRRRHEKLC